MSYRQMILENVVRDVRRIAREDVPVWLETVQASDLERVLILYYGLVQRMNSYELTQLIFPGEPG